MKKPLTLQNWIAFLLISCCLPLAFSCSTSKHMDYFTYPAYDSSHMFVHENYEVPIKVGDQLIITLTSLKPEYAIPYTVPGNKPLVVDSDGYILYPQLGTIKVVGLTRPQLRDLLINKLKVYLIDPVVLVEFKEFKVSVLGEVGRQGVITAPDGKLNLLEALAQSGDITPYGRRESVVVIRETNGKREFGYVNMLSHNFFTTPYYRLQQNDVIYVRSRNKPSVSEQEITRKISFASTILGVFTTIAFLVLTITRN